MRIQDIVYILLFMVINILLSFLWPANRVLKNIVIKKSTEKLHLFKHHNTGNLSKFNFTNPFKSSIFIKSNCSLVVCSNF